jgi:HEAT repeat protein
VGRDPTPSPLVDAFVALGEPALGLALVAFMKVLRARAQVEDGPSTTDPSPEQALVLRFGGPAAAAVVKHYVAYLARIPDAAFRGEEPPAGMVQVIEGVSQLLVQLGPPSAPIVAALLRRAALADAQRKRDQEKEEKEQEERQGSGDEAGGPAEDAPGTRHRQAEEQRAFSWQFLATQVLARLSPPTAVAAVATLVRDPSAAVREAGVEALDEIVRPEALELAIRALGDPVADVRLAAVKVLARHPDARVVPLLIQRLADDATLVVSYAVRDLVKRRAIEARGPLCDALRRHTRYAFMVQTDALEGLSALGSIPCAPDVLRLLGSQSVFVRAAAARAAGTLGTPAAVAGVRPLLKDPLEVARAAAVTAAGVLLGRVPDRGLAQGVRAALNDAAAPVRQAAARVAGLLADRAAVSALVKLAGDPAAEVRAAALDALGQVGDRSALRAVERALGDAVVTPRQSAHLAYYLITGKLHATAQARLQAAPTCARMTALLACFTAALPAARRQAARAPLLPVLLKALETTPLSAAIGKALEAACVKAVADLTTKAGAVPSARRCVPR